jgi:hypothetical protein
VVAASRAASISSTSTPSMRWCRISPVTSEASQDFARDFPKLAHVRDSAGRSAVIPF